MRRGHWVTLDNGSGVLDRRFAEEVDGDAMQSERNVKDAVLDLINSVGYLTHGDSIKVLEGESE